MTNDDWDYEMKQDALHYLTEQDEERPKKAFDYDPDLFFDDYIEHMEGNE